MQAYKIITAVENGFLHIPMPQNFEGKKVEVIVLETWLQEALLDIEKDEPPTHLAKPNPFQTWLLTAPVWEEADYENFLNIRQAFNRWEL